jgi:hypothetical protein
MVTMPFGRHKGSLLCEIPQDYLEWALRTCDRLSYWLRSEIEDELERRRFRQRRSPPPPPPPQRPPSWETIIARWHREMAREVD